MPKPFPAEFRQDGIAVARCAVKDACSGRIEVSVTDGTFTLSGEVDSYQEKYLPVEAAQRAHGVTAIAQEIDVRASSWTHLSDTDVARNAGEALKWAIDVPSTVKASVHDHSRTYQAQTARPPGADP